MDPYEFTSIIFTKVKSMEPDNASKIMGYIMIQDLAEKDLMRLALGPESLLHSLVLRVKIQLGLSSNISSASTSSSTPSSPSPLNPIARPSTIAANPFSQSSPRMIHNGFPSSPSSSTNSWPLSGFSNNSPKASPLLSYDNIRSASSFPSPLYSSSSNGVAVAGDGSTSGGGGGSGSGELIDENQLSDYLSFLSEDMSDPRVEQFRDWAHHSNGGGDAHFHRRSFSASDASFGSDELGLGGGAGGFKPCLYFARGFCKNGSNCKFVHGGCGGGGFSDTAEASGAVVGSPSKFEGLEQQHHEEMMRLKVAAAQQQRLMAGLSPSVYNKYLNFLLQQQHQHQHDPQRAAAIMMGEELYKFGRCRPERNDFLSMASVEKMNSASRQIYLTFPAESTFKDEDVSEYFNKFGPVQDVRIPYQQKRMFGFVTFVHPETVRFILSKGNPHFICDSRVLVKPYKEKGKILDKRQQHQQQQLERGEFSTCLSPSGLDRDSYDLPFGGRMLYNAQDIILQRKLEQQAELQQAIEFQGRRLMNLQLPEFKNDRLHHHQRSLSVGAPVLLPSQSLSLSRQNANLPFDTIKQEVTEGDVDSHAMTVSATSAVSVQEHGEHRQEETSACVLNDGQEQVSISEDLDVHKSVEQALPDSLFASPTKSAGNHLSDFSTAVAEEVDQSATLPSETNPSSPATSAGL